MRIDLLASLCLLTLLACLSTFAAEEQGSIRAFKGWELYSWKSGKSWQFSLLKGTNRCKQCAEIKNAKGILSIDQVETSLATLAKSEYIVWIGKKAANISGQCDLAMPPSSTVRRIKARCKKGDLVLSISQ